MMKDDLKIVIVLLLSVGVSFSQFIVKNSSDDDILYINNKGSVGINQTPGEVRLDVLDPDVSSTMDLMRVQETVSDGVSSVVMPRLILKDEGRFGVGTDSPVSFADFIDMDENSTADLFTVREATPGSPFPILRTRMIVKNDGYIGINTVNPREFLHVEGAILVGNTMNSNEGAIRYSGTDFEGYDGTSWKSLTATGGSSLWSQNGSDIYYNSGFVGVGTSAPTYLLHVHDTDPLSPNNLFTIEETRAGSPFNITFQRMVVKDGGLIGIHDPNTDYRFSVGSALMLKDASAPKYTNNYSGLYSNTGELYAIDGSGNTTLLSPHDRKTGEWIFYSKNIKTGRVVRVDMEQMIRDIEELTGNAYLQEWTE
ncbi:hypothetical protein GF407_06775 [candidate division KSB1 bacterium]|nr:hypothetical protein [candidate division KSB1 bacterium]